MKKFLRPYAWQMAIMILLSLAGALVGLAQPYLSKYLVDEALLRSNWRALWLASVMMLVAAAAGFTLSYVSGLGYMRLSTAMLFDMRVEVYRRLHSLSPRFYARARLGDLVSRLNGDIAEVQRISADTFLSSLSNVAFLIGSIVMMIWLSGSLFLAGTILLPVSIAVFRNYQTRITALNRELREKSATIGTLFVETLMGVRLVACFNASDFEMQRFQTANDSYVSTLMRFQSASLLGRSLPGLVLTLATVAVFVVGGAQIMDGRMSIGALVAFMAYHARLISPVQNLLGLSAALSSARVSLGRVLELLDAPCDVEERSGALRVEGVRDGIEFHDVRLRHDGRTILDSLSARIPAGSFCSIVGPSGSGKSTMADLMVRLLDPDSGKLTLDGIDLRDLKIADLRRTVVLIDQTPHILHGSLRENIAYAKPGIGKDEVLRAAQAAGLGNLLERLPAGLETIAGERGLTLSAGERQRVALARAFLVNPEVVILDEPSAALDSAGEQDLLRRLRQSFAGKTLIVITHKPLLAEAADWTIRIEHGQVLESAVFV
jgi:ATP-binding cassette subfamily B protein